MKILVTGGSGFVGRDTIKALEERGDEVFNYDISKGHDLRIIEDIYYAVKQFKPDVILHLAAIARFADADNDQILCFEVNVIGTKNIVEVAREFNVPIIYTSTGSVYMPIEKLPLTEDNRILGNSTYGCSKSIGEKYVMTHSPYIILRYAHLYGAEKKQHGLIGGFLDKIQAGEAPILHGGDQTNDFTYIKDITKANLLAIDALKEDWNEAYNIGTGIELSAREAGKILCDVVGYKGEIKITPPRSVDPDRFIFDCSKAERMLGFKADWGFKEGLKDMLGVYEDELSPDV